MSEATGEKKELSHAWRGEVRLSNRVWGRGGEFSQNKGDVSAGKGEGCRDCGSASQGCGKGTEVPLRSPERKC